MLLPVLIDSRPVYLGDAPGATLLRTPVGRGLLADHLLRCLGPYRKRDLAVLATFDYDDQYVAAIKAACDDMEVAVVRWFDALLDRCEPSDWLLVLDAACCPLDVLPAAILAGGTRDPRQATHLVTIDAVGEAARESVCHDADGRVRKVQRYYRGVTAADGLAEVASLVSGSVARTAAGNSLVSVDELRRVLAERRAPSRDALVEGMAVRLSHERGLLTLNEALLLRGQDVAAERTSISGAAGAQISDQAHLRGRVVVGPGAVIEAGATVVGPAALGAESRVERGALVAHCIVAAGAVVAGGQNVHQRYVARDADWRDLGRIQVPDPDETLRAEFSRPDDGGEADRREVYATLKWIGEALISIVALTLLGPLFLVIAILIRLESRGPIFYLDPREGRGGRVFRCWKFRTMVVDAHAMQRKLYERNRMDGPQFKLSRDPRITRMGRILRGTNIDELPQLINVVRGEMSLIGPRPSPFRENQICVAWRGARLSVRPGITGLWQICRADRSSGDFHQWILYDILYVRHMSFLLDVKILLATALTCGGRWSVPVSWVIPAHKLFDESQTRIMTRAPILAAHESDSNEPTLVS